MPAKMKPLIKTFPLPKTDAIYGDGNGEEMSTVTIKQATQGTATLRASELNDFDLERVLTSDDQESSKVKKHISFSVIRKIEVCNTVVGCNLMDENGEPFFKFLSGEAGPVSTEQFWKKWNLLDPRVADEIYECILDMNPTWGPDYPN